MKIRIKGKNYENVKLHCAIVEDYFDLIECIQEREEQGKMMSKEQRQMMKEFIVKVFGCGFTTEDIDTDEELEYSDLMIYFLSIGKEIQNKTQNKLEKLAKK